MQYLISIIVPVYNAANTIGETLDSLLAQTYQHIEVICVNDGSSDDSRDILNLYSLCDSRVKVISQSNSGVSIARNTGISHVSQDCEIIMFVDADDKLVPRACEQIAKVFSREHPDVFTFGLACDPPEVETASLKRDFAPPADKVYEPFSVSLLFKEKSRPYACRTALSYDFVKREGIRFEPGIKLGEDQVFYFTVYPFSRKTVLSSERLYLYKMNQGSATHQDCSFADRVHQHLLVLEAIVRIWDEKGFRDECCMRELLEWTFEFFMLDIGKLLPDEQMAAWSRCLTAMDFYLEAPERYARRWLTKRCLRDVRNVVAGRNPSVSRSNVTAFYLMRLGLIHSLERILIKLGIVK